MSALLEAALAEKARRQGIPEKPVQEIPAPASPLLQAALAEKARREGKSPQETPDRSFSRFVGEQLVKGALNMGDFFSMVGKGMMQQGIPNNLRQEHEMKVPEGSLAKLGEKHLPINTEPEDTGIRRMVGSTARAASAGLAGGPTNILRNTLLASAQGLSSGALREVGVPDVAAELIPAATILGGPIAYNKAKKLYTSPQTKAAKIMQQFAGEENIPAIVERLENKPVYQSGYQPTTAEIAESEGLASLHRQQYEAPKSKIARHIGKESDKVRTSLENASSGNIVDTQKAASQKLNELESVLQKDINNIGPMGATTEEAGEAIQGSLTKELGKRKLHRQKTTEPLYQEVANITENVSLPGSEEYIFNELKAAKGKVKKGLQSASALFRPNETANKISKIDPVTLNPIPTQKGSTPFEIKNSIEQLNGLIGEAKTSGNRTLFRKLNEYKSRVLRDMEAIPAEAAARNKYAELSVPVNAIEEQKTLGSIVKTNKTGKLESTPSRVTEKFLRAAEGSADDARALMKEVGHDKEMLDVVHQDMNRRAAEGISNPITGHVDPNKLANFMKKYPAMKVIYPELFETKLINVQNAQQMVNKYYKEAAQVASSLERNALGQYVPGSTQGLEKKIFSGDSYNNIRSINKAIGSDELAKEGLRKLTIDHMRDSISNAGAQGRGRVLSFDKTNKFLSKNGKGMREILTPEQMTLVEETANIVNGQNNANTLGASTFSPTQARQMIDAEFGKKLTMGPKWVQYLYNNVLTTSPEKTMQFVNKAMIDPAIAKEMLTRNFKSNYDFNKFMNDVNRSSISFLLAKDKKEED